MPRPRASLLLLTILRPLGSVLASPFFKRSIAGAASALNGSYGMDAPHDEPADTPGGPDFWWHIAVSTILVLAGGVFAGLTLGLMGLDELHLRVLATSSEDLKEKANAQKVLKLMQRGRHWVLVVLLLSNVVINESLPIFLHSATGGGVAAVVISTVAIGAYYLFSGMLYIDVSVFFGAERLTFLFSGFFCSLRVIPQALCARYGLAIGATCAPLVLGMMYLFAPIAYPIAKLLDWALGANEQHTYKKAELKSFLQFHRTGEEPLRDDEIAILNGVLELNTKNVEKIMTPMKDTVILSSDAILDHKAVDAILLSGYSRFPVHEPGNPLSFVGLLLIKKLLTYDPAKALPVSAFQLSILPEAHPSINCFQALDYFQTGRAHLLLISRTPGVAGGAIGVITLEDIIEEIISEEIVDETDRYEDNQHKRRAKRATTAAIMRGIVERETRRRNTKDALSQHETSPAPVDREQATERTPLLLGKDTTASANGRPRSVRSIKRLSYLLAALRFVSASPFLEVIEKKKKHKTGHPGVERGSPEFWYHLTVSVILVLIGGVFAGLTLGLMGLDELHLRVLATSSEDKKERQDAHKAWRRLSGYCNINNSYRFVNVLLFLASTTCHVNPLLIRTGSVFRGYRIIPQSVSVHYGLSIGARCTPLVLTLMYLLAPVAWPIAKLLDWILGENEQHTYKKAELKSFLQFHRTGDEPLRDDEITILNGVLELNTKGVESIMTPLKDVVVLSADDILDYGAVHAISQSGYSRIPVHEPGNQGSFIGLLLVKKLLTYDPKKALPVSAFPLSILPEAPPSINCFQALDYFQTGRAHLLLISRTPGRSGGAIGVVTLEGMMLVSLFICPSHSSTDIIEEIISEEIVDETDQYEDNQSKRRVRRTGHSTTFGGIVERRHTVPSYHETSSLLEHPRSHSVDSCLVPYGSV
ncbi:hypothetical protein CVT24_010757 [Panaeolus cyanescens]|uniref:CNNM transmembrane domain-containing protein n=1 Tax=Panaeolus cyanescens TaxID=181874 RepID=A0A409WE84_9AGAR|nr:hypothetical protein CVT24_010757 [Panaeolus cyanescens]